MRPGRNGFTPLEIKISNGRSKKFLTGFTVVELLTVLAIIAIMVGILVPALNYVRNTARVAKQSTQFAAIDMALMAFKGDTGNYPPSDNAGGDYCGAQKLCEALLGWDLLGFHPDSELDGDRTLYESCDPLPPPCDMERRLGPYLELGTANAFKLEQLFGTTSTGLDTDTYVLCDSFGAKPVTVGGKHVKAGRPILYYRAKTNSKDFTTPADEEAAKSKIYNCTDNIKLIKLKMDSEDSSDPLYGLDPTSPSTLDGTFLYSLYWPPTLLGYKLKDPKIIAYPWPHRPSSYILISAGVDGLYGTQDDICNF